MKFFILIISLSIAIHTQGFSSSTDSIELKLSSLPLNEQFKVLNSLRYEYITTHAQELIPIYHRYIKIAQQQNKYLSQRRPNIAPGAKPPHDLLRNPIVSQRRLFPNSRDLSEKAANQIARKADELCRA